MIKRLPWNKKQITFVKNLVVNKQVHPKDALELYLKKWPDGRTYSSLRTMLYDNKISWEGLTQKSSAKPILKPAEAVNDDIEKHRLSQKICELNSKYKVLVKQKSIADRIEQVLRDEIKALPKVDLKWKNPQAKVTEETTVLMLGDLHLGENVDKVDTFGFGEYNFEIFNKRLKFLAEKMTSITTDKLRGYKMEKLVIFGMGDMVSGRIHDELAENSEDMIFQVMNGAYVTAQFILELSQVYPEIEIDGVLGNHGRLTKQPRFKKRYTNWDYVYYQMLSMFLANNQRIKCTFPKCFFHVKKIYGWGFLVLHGDNINSWMGIPWYGIQKGMWKLGDLLQGKGQVVHYRLLGHFHNTGEIDRTPGEIMINGSMIGGNEYSLGKMFEFGRPTQVMFGVHPEIGVTWRYPLRLDDKRVDEVEGYNYNSELDAGKYMKALLDSHN